MLFRSGRDGLRGNLGPHRLPQVHLLVVSMESTGSYWIPVFNLLEGHVRVVLANPEEVKNRKGHKTDRKDAEHLADLLRHNHVKSSCIPAEPVHQLRDLTRRRVQLTQDATRELNRAQKLLEQVNVKIGSVLTDVFGVSGLHMLLALLDGRAAPEEIAGLARGSAKRKTPQLIEAIEGNRMSDHVRFLIRGCLRHLACLEEEVEELDTEILRRMLCILVKQVVGHARWSSSHGHVLKCGKRS